MKMIEIVKNNIKHFQREIHFVSHIQLMLANFHLSADTLISLIPIDWHRNRVPIFFTLLLIISENDQRD